MRTRSHAEEKAVFWVAALDEAVDRDVVEVFRSKEILARKERSAQTKDEMALISEEKARLRRRQDDLRRRLRQAMLAGTVFFRGNDRSPDESAAEVGRTASRILGQVLPDVFYRFDEAAARVQRKDLDAVLTTENLRGLTPVYTELHLVREQAGKVVFETDAGPLAEVLRRIENRSTYGELVTGRYLADELEQEPFGWDFDVVRLLAMCLLRAGKVEATSKGQVIDSRPEPGGSQHLSQQQPVPTGILPAQGGRARLRAGCRGLRARQGGIRPRRARDRAGSRWPGASARRPAATKPICRKSTRRW